MRTEEGVDILGGCEAESAGSMEVDGDRVGLVLWGEHIGII